MFVSNTESGSDEDDGADDTDLNEELQLDNDLFHDIEELGEEEQRMLRQSETDDTEGEQPPIDFDSKIPAVAEPLETGLGQTEDDAILLDDDEEEPAKQAPTIINAVPTSTQPKAASAAEENTGAGASAQTSSAMTVASNNNTPVSDPNESLKDCRLYKVIFGEPRLGLEITLFDGRAVVANVLAERTMRVGANSKPAVGDILVSIAGYSLSRVSKLDQIVTYLKHVLRKPPVTLMFVEAPVFAEQYKLHLMSSKQSSAPRASKPPVDTDGVIDLIDDD